MVVQEPGNGELAAARAAADRLLGFEHGDADALAGERDRAGQPVGAGADDDCFAHAIAGWADRSPPRRVTSTGKSQDSSSQGPRSSMSATSTQPSSTSPDAASQMR